MLTEKDISKIVSRIAAVAATKKDVTVLGKRMEKIENRLVKVDTRLSGVELALIHVDHKFEEVKSRLDSLDAKFDRQLVLLDKLIAKVETMTLEYAAVSTQLSRHEEWIKALAEKAGVKLEY